ncbi:MAG: hypothetical protein R3B60_03095 [Candidatus Paceibacterota bacterium]
MSFKEFKESFNEMPFYVTFVLVVHILNPGMAIMAYEYENNGRNKVGGRPALYASVASFLTVCIYVLLFIQTDMYYMEGFVSGILILLICSNTLGTFVMLESGLSKQKGQV